MSNNIITNNNKNNDKEEDSRRNDVWWQDFSVKFNVWKNSISHSVASFLLPDSPTIFGRRNSNIKDFWILGTKYSSEQDHLNFWAHFRSIVWMTYRLDFPPIHGTLHTTDVGWGCMIRSGQSLMASALLIHYMGKDWRLGTVHHRNHLKTYRQILSFFIDSPLPTHIFSIHKITVKGHERLGTPIGSWYGPSAIAQVLADIANENSIKNDQGVLLKIHVVLDGCVYIETVRQLLDQSAILLLIPLRLGTLTLNPVYYSKLKDHLKQSSSVGICGGRPHAALYFVGIEGDSLIHLDPHFPRPALESKTDYSVEDLLSYHCDNPKTTPLSQVDPSLLIGHYIESNDAFDEFCRLFHDQSDLPLFSIMRKEPNLNEDFDVESIDEFE